MCDSMALHAAKGHGLPRFAVSNYTVALASGLLYAVALSYHDEQGLYSRTLLDSCYS